MYTQVEKSKENKSRAVANSVAQKTSAERQSFGFVPNRKGTNVIKAIVQKKNNLSSTKREYSNTHPNSQKEGVVQRLLVSFKTPGAPTADETDIINDANIIEGLTTAAYNNTWNRLVAATQALNPVPLTIGHFPGITQGHFANFLNRLRGNSDAQKAMATGYVIEYQVSNNPALPAAADAQVGVGNAIPDFVIKHNMTRGIVDITSSRQQGHVLNKNFNPAGFSYISEAIYPSINFNALAGAAPVMGVNALAIAQQARVENANRYMRRRINQLKEQLNLYSTGIMRGNVAFDQAASNLMNAVNGLPNAQWTQIGNITPIDVLIGNVNGTLSRWAHLPTLSQMIIDAQAKYMIAGNPIW